MTSNCPQVYWHWAVSPVHQQVATASFIQTAQDAGLKISYEPTDSAAPLLEEVASHIGVPLYPALDKRLSTHGSLEAWIGTHDPENPTRCARLMDQADPPRVILCLAKGTHCATPPGVPEGHATYVTGIGVVEPAPLTPDSGSHPAVNGSRDNAN